jgi:hypothetical protein
VDVPNSAECINIHAINGANPRVFRRECLQVPRRGSVGRFGRDVRHEMRIRAWEVRCKDRDGAVDKFLFAKTAGRDATVSMIE